MSSAACMNCLEDATFASQSKACLFGFEVLVRLVRPHEPMNERRWLRIIPVALIMYTISYVDRTNVSLALDPKISTMMKDLHMGDAMRGWAIGIFFFGYLPL